MASHMAGFTLVELMITLALVVLILTLINVNVTFLDKQVVRSQVNVLRTACNYVRYSAIVNNRQQVLLFDQANNSYTFNGHKELLGNAVSFGVLPLAKGPPSDPLHPIHSPITFVNKRIVFTPGGIIQPGTVYMVDRGQKVMYALTSPIANFSYLRTYYYQGTWAQV